MVWILTVLSCVLAIAAEVPVADPGEIRPIRTAAALSAAFPSRSDGIRREIIDRVNVQRKDRGLPVLAPSPLMRAVAQLHAVNMADYSYFGHTDLEGRKPLGRVLEVQPFFTGIVRENLYYCTACPDSDSAAAEHAVASLMASPGHRANLLARDVVTMDIGVAFGRNIIVIVQLLARCYEYGIR